MNVAECDYGTAAFAARDVAKGDVLSRRNLSNMHKADSINELAMRLVEAEPTGTVPYMSSLKDSDALVFALRTVESLQVVLGQAMLRMVRMRLREADRLAEARGLTQRPACHVGLFH